MKIKVTEEHIRNGRRRETRYCPIALALRANPKYTYVRVGTTFCNCDTKSRYYLYDLPAEATKFVKDFDEGAPVEPFTFNAKLIAKMVTSERW